MTTNARSRSTFTDMVCACIGAPMVVISPGKPSPLRERACGVSGYGDAVILVVAATSDELRGAGSAETLVCGVGPVDAAARTAEALAGGAPDGPAARRDRGRPQLRRAGVRDRKRGGLLRRRRSALDRAARAARRRARRRRAPGAAGGALRADRHLGAGRRLERLCGRGDGGLRRPSRSCAGRRSRGRGARALERGRRARPRPLADGRGEGAARRRAARHSSRRSPVPELPPPLPPGDRTVGQLVAETIRTYGDHFWRVLATRHPARRRRPAQRPPGRDGADARAAGRVARSSSPRVRLGVPARAGRARRPHRGHRRAFSSICRSRPCVRCSSSRESRGSRSSGLPSRRQWSRGARSATRSPAAASSASPTTSTRSARSRRSSSSSASPGTTLSALLHTQGDNGQRVAPRRVRPRPGRSSSSAARCCISTRQPG